MRAEKLIALLSKSIPLHEPVLITGAPGVGKSDIVAQAARAAKADLVIFHPVVSDPTDFKGLPAVVEGVAQFLPYGDLVRLISAKKLTVAFLDDIGQAPAVVQAALMQLILARQVNGHKISDHVVFVGATNRREDKSGVTGILEAVKSRFSTIVNLDAHLDDWSAWAITHGVPAELVAFVRFRRDLFSNPGEPTNALVNRPSPRTITALGRLFTAGIRDLEALEGAAGKGFAAEFIGFIRVFEQLPSIDAILLTPDKAPVPTEPSALYAVATAVASRITHGNAARVITYLDRLPKEFSVLGVRDGLRVCPAAAANARFVQWATDNQDVLV